MPTFIAVVRDDGTVEIPDTVAQPGRTVVIIVPETAPDEADHDQQPETGLDRLTARTPEQKRALLNEVLTMGRLSRARLSEQQRTSNHDWLYDDQGLPT